MATAIRPASSSTMAEAADALASVDADYERHCRAAREIAEACFDAKQVVATMLNAVGRPNPVRGR